MAEHSGWLLRRMLLPVARRISPAVQQLEGDDLLWRVSDVLLLMVAGPLSVVGVLWLVLVTDLMILRDNWLFFLLALALMFLLYRLDFFAMMRGRDGATIEFSVSLGPVVGWSAVLLFGPTALWLYLPVRVVDALRHVYDDRNYWVLGKNLLAEAYSHTFAALLALSLFEFLGGKYPLDGLNWEQLAPAMVSIFFWIGMVLLLFLPAYVFLGSGPIYRFGSSFALVDPFGILAAAIYSNWGSGAFIFLMAGMAMSALLAHSLSRVIERSRQRSRELANLEQLERDLMDMLADSTSLPAVLEKHLPVMFPRTDIEVRLFPDVQLLGYPKIHAPAPESFWEWLKENPQATCIRRRDGAPWDSDTVRRSVLAVPIIEPEGGQTIGGFYLRVGNIYSRWDTSGGASLIPAVTAVADQIAAGLRRAGTYRESLFTKQLEQELALAVEIQTSFLPHSLPDVPGWRLGAGLQSAQRTAGDFYDVILLPGDWIGVVVADVADRGLGAALMTALCRTLLRIYAPEYSGRPERVMRAVNRRILEDTSSGLFVAALYGVIEPRTGEFRYCNAGYHPPFVRSGKTWKKLTRRKGTKKGLPLGMFEEASWHRQTATISPGDLLVLYTDGIHNAQNAGGEMFGAERMKTAIEENSGAPVADIPSIVFRSVHQFAGGEPLADDLTLVAVEREM